MKQLLEIIKQKGVGEYLGLCDTAENSDKAENYAQYIQMTFSPDDKRYSVELLTNLKFFSQYPEKQFYIGEDKKTAKKIFNKAVEEGRSKIQPKENKLEEKFSEN